MKEEIEELMNKENGIFKINKHFKLVKNDDTLELQCNLVKPNFRNTAIKAKEYQGIENEIETIMKSDIDIASHLMISNFKNGYTIRPQN